MGKFILFVHASAESEAGTLPTQEEMTEMSAFNDKLREAGTIYDMGGLVATKTFGTRVQFSEESDSPRVEPGPFELENLISGFWIVELPSFEEAVAWAKKVPFKKGAVTVRKVAGPEDFGKILEPKAAD
jgi:hypothetical protein